MNRVELVFAAIDVFFHPMQNFFKVKGIESEKDMVYPGGYPENKADYFYKKDSGKLPILINIHGGGFVKGDKKHRRSISELYADKGYFVINVNYRLSPKSKYPAVIEDIFNLLSSLPDLAVKYNLDMNKVVITGDSSGAYTSAMVTACLYDDELRRKLSLPECSVKLSGVIGFSGLYDPVAVFNKKFPFGMARVLGSSITGIKLGKKLEGLDNYEFIDYFAPIKFINEKWPPVLVAYAKKDIFCKGQGEEFVAALQEKGIPVEEVYATSIVDNHCYHFNFWTKTSKTTMSKVFEFLEKIKNS